MTDDAVEFAKRFLSGPVLSDDVKASSPQEFENIAKALQQATINPDANDFDILVMLAADGLSRNERLPEWLAAFAADVLSGKRKRPTKRGPDKYGNWERDYKLWRATQEVAKAFGLQRYSNNELSKKTTAAEILSSAGACSDTNELSKKTTAAEIVSRAAGCEADVVITAYKKFNKKFSRTMGVK
jgi:hypothetical protein